MRLVAPIQCRDWHARTCPSHFLGPLPLPHRCSPHRRRWNHHQLLNQWWWILLHHPAHPEHQSCQQRQRRQRHHQQDLAEGPLSRTLSQISPTALHRETACRTACRAVKNSLPLFPRCLLPNLLRQATNRKHRRLFQLSMPATTAGALPQRAE